MLSLFLKKNIDCQIKSECKNFHVMKLGFKMMKHSLGIELQFKPFDFHPPPLLPGEEKFN